MTNITNILFIVILTSTMLSCGHSSSPQKENQSKDQLQNDTCDNPDANINCCFVNMPESVSEIMLITRENEPGERLIIKGVIFKPDGTTPYANLFLYAYHTDNTGLYSKIGNETGFQKWHGHLHGWCKTDKNGHYEIHTIRPAPYPRNLIPAHIHMAVKSDNDNMFYITDFVFNDDSLVNEKYLSSLTYVGGTGIVDVKKNAKNIWIGDRNIIIK